MSKNSNIALALLLLGVMLVACASGDPVEQVAKTRARYSARLNGFYVQAEPQVVEPLVEEGVEAAAEPEEAVEPDLEAAAEPMPEPVAPVQNAHLDIILQHDSATKLAGITIDITMVDAAQQEKGSWRHWVDTSTLEKANQMQFTYVIEDLPYVEGDGFSVEVRHPVPVAERGEYREFSVGD